MPKLEWSPDAANKLIKIQDYITEEFDSPIAAENTINKVLERVERLTRFPDSGVLLSAIYERVPARNAKTQFVVCGSYIVIYDVEGDTVKILQVYHGSEDYIRHLFQGR